MPIDDFPERFRQVERERDEARALADRWADAAIDLCAGRPLAAEAPSGTVRLAEVPGRAGRTQWRSPDDPPSIPEGEMVAVVVARRSPQGSWHVFGAWYLNAYPLDDSEDAEDDKAWTGFHEREKHDDYDGYFSPIEITLWAPMPEAPTDDLLAAKGQADA